MAPGFFRQHTGLILVTAACSIALSIWCVWADPIINDDGVYYFRAAERIAIGKWQEAVAIYSWPFFPALIAWLSDAVGVDVVLAAYVLNAVLAAVLVVAFLAVVSELGGDRSTLVFAALLILAFPALNKYRSFIVRDIGYVAFYLWSLYFLFRYWKQGYNSSLFAWFSCGAVSCLFRVEGLAVMAVVPVMLFSLSRYAPRRRWVQVAMFAGVGAVLFFLLGVWLIRDAIIGQAATVDPGEIIAGIGRYVDHMVGGKLELLKEKFAGRYYLVVYVMIIVVVTLAEIIRRLSLIYAVLPIWGLKKRILFPAMALKPLWLGLILVHTLILLGSAFLISIVVDRYALAVTITILLASPFVFAHLWRSWGEAASTGGSRWALPSLLVLVMLFGINGLDVFTDKRHLADAGAWIRENTSPDATLHSNNLIVIHYSGKDAYHEDDNYSWKHTYGVIKGKQWKQFDYVAIDLGPEDYPWTEWLDIHLHGPPLKRFQGESGSTVLIYKNPSSSDTGSG